MAYDKAVDSAVLDAGLTSVADAIRQKGGTSASLTFPQGFVDAIGEISGGYDKRTWAQMAVTMALIGDTAGVQPEDMTIDMTYLRSFCIPREWNIDSGLRILRFINNTNPIKFTNNIPIIELSSTSPTQIAISCNRGIREIHFERTVMLTGDLNSFFQYMYDLEAIYGDLDFSGVTAWTYGNWFLACSKLTHLRVVPNSAATVSTMNCGNLSAIDDDTLISIANGLADTTDAHTLTLAAAKKARTAEITGDSALDGTGTYHVFTPSATGSITLRDFITTVKGWTLA